ncbi:MAG TPA: acylphosphatase, partial [Xanthomonadaceae bacterium]|nr:acylphosphatase [Xanthomonadaceae bacterium]
VEVIAAGEPAALDALAEWLRAGPPLARVEAVSREPWQATVSTGFTTG